MRDKGDISTEEYEQLKANLLGGGRKPAALPQRKNQIDDSTRWWLVGSGVLIAVGSFLPWAESGIFSVAGTRGDGIITLIGGVIVALVGIANRESIGAGVGVVVIAGLSLWIAFSVIDRLEGDSVGAGLILTAIASLVAVIVGIQLILEARRARENKLPRL
jgi:peptidoglycan/LPS O-acetylase OafA/YrhL